MYGLAPAPQQIFISPDTQLVASNGKVWFFRDADRTTIKPVYRNTGTPSSPVYTQYELNPDGSISLNASGAFPHFVYYYPYTSGGVIDLYYIVAKTSDGLIILAEGNYPTINPDNGQIVFIISTACAGTPDLTDQTQLAEAVSQYVHVSNYYVDGTNTPNTYVAVREGGQSEELPCQLQDGLAIRFAPNGTSTGNCTFTFTTKSGTTTKPLLMPISGDEVPPGAIQGADVHGVKSCGYEFTYRNQEDVWFMTNDPYAATPIIGKVYATDTDPNPPATLINKLTAGGGISIVPSSDNSHVVLSRPFAQNNLTITTPINSTTIINSATDGTNLISQAFTPLSSTSTLEIELIISGDIINLSGSAGAVVYITFNNSTFLANGVLGPNQRAPSMALRAIIANPGVQTYTARFGVSNNTGNVQIQGNLPNIFPAVATLTIKEYHQ